MALRNINVKIDTELWHQAKIEATKLNKSLQSFLDEALREKIGKVSCQPEKQN